MKYGIEVTHDGTHWYRVAIPWLTEHAMFNWIAWSIGKEKNSNYVAMRLIRQKPAMWGLDTPPGVVGY